jgi:hypothetical protein
MFDQIEKLKQEYTDKYVVVDASRPELARFDGFTGQVKTVNMSGRALVEFDAWNNIGWYDIDVDFLTVVPKPEPKAEEPAAKKAAPAKAAPAAKPAASGDKKLSPLEMARQQGAAKSASAAEKAAPGAKPKASTADILAAARANKAAAPSAAAAAKPASGAAQAGKKPSTAEILSAARANKAAEAPPAQEEDAITAEEAPVPAKPPAKPAAPAKSSGARLSVAEQLAWCREHDAK